MAATISCDRWVEFVTREYLQSFIAEGGAAIKCAVPMDEVLRVPTLSFLREAAVGGNYLFAHLDAAKTKIHMMDQVFFAVAEQLSWVDLCERVVTRLAAKAGYESAAPGPEPLLLRMAAQTGLDPNVIKMEMWKSLERDVYKNPHIVKDLRVALFQLCQAVLVGGEEGGTTVRVLTDWLTGKNQAVSAVRPYFIATRINRTNARPMFESLLHWIRLAGRPGLVLTMDLARLTVSHRPKDASLYYSKSALLDAYELLRQFLDSTDRLNGCFVVMMPAAEILDEDNGRSLAVYTALKNRIYDEVRDRNLVNPMASLVRLASAAEGVA